MDKYIFYGAGEYSKEHFEDFKREYEPICFCDGNACSGGRELCGFPVLPPSACLEKYPEVPIVITAHPTETKPFIQEYLIGELGIPVKRIVNYTEFEKVPSCWFLENIARLFKKKWVMCCSPWLDRVPEVSFGENDTPQLKVDKFLNLRDSLRKSLSKKEECACSGCPLIEERYCLKEPQLTYIGINFVAICNLNCVYCTQIKEISKFAEFQNIDFLPTFLELRSRKLVNRDTEIALAMGEITVHPKRKEILSSLAGFNTKIHSNLVLWDDIVARHLSLGNSTVNCSVDAGTSETYAKIKGADCFHHVCENLKRVAELSKLELKYIFMEGINDNDADVEGFIRLAADVRPNLVMVSRPNQDKSPSSDRMLNYMANIIIAMDNLSIKTSLWQETITKNERERLAHFVRKKKCQAN